MSWAALLKMYSWKPSLNAVLRIIYLFHFLSRLEAANSPTERNAPTLDSQKHWKCYFVEICLVMKTAL